MNANDAFPSNYLKASDLQGKDCGATIDKVLLEEVGREKDRKLVAYFKGKEKGLVLNKTNTHRIMDIAGTPETDEWAGTYIVLFPTETEFGGESVECIRIRAKGRPPARPVAPVAPVPEKANAEFAANDDDVPF